VVLLASFWMILPVFSILGDGFASMVEMVTMLFSLSDMRGYIAILLTVYGMIVFNKKDIEY
jgi:hypothetical protein